MLNLYIKNEVIILLNENFYTFDIGSAQVNTVLLNESISLGEKLIGEIRIKGGKMEQKIDSIYLYFWTFFSNGQETSKINLSDHKLNDPMVIHPYEEKILPFEVYVDYSLPITTFDQDVYLSTGLSIKDISDPKDTDPVQILPDHLTQSFLNVLSELDYVETEDSGKAISFSKKEPRFASFKRILPFVQPFIFEGKKKSERIELVFDIYQEEVLVSMTLERKNNDIISHAFSVKRNSFFQEEELRSLLLNKLK